MSESQVKNNIQKRNYTLNRETLRRTLKAQKQSENPNENKIKTFDDCAEEVILNFKNISIKTPSKMCIIS